MAGEHAGHVLHRIRQHPLVDAQEQVVVVAHQAVGEKLHAQVLVDPGQLVAEVETVIVGQEDGLTVDAAVHHMVDAALRLPPWRSRHAAIMTDPYDSERLVPDPGCSRTVGA